MIHIRTDYNLLDERFFHTFIVEEQTVNMFTWIEDVTDVRWCPNKNEGSCRILMLDGNTWIAKFERNEEGSFIPYKTTWGTNKKAGTLEDLGYVWGEVVSALLDIIK